VRGRGGANQATAPSAAVPAPPTASHSLGKRGSAAAPDNADAADALQRLRAENAELQRQLQNGPAAQAWDEWLASNMPNKTGCSSRVLLLKGRLLQQEWAVRWASHVLTKQQVVLTSSVHGAAVPSETEENQSASRARALSLQEAVDMGREFLESGLSQHTSASKVATTEEHLRGALLDLLTGLFSCYPRTAALGEGTSEIRACVVALSSLGAAESGRSLMPFGKASTMEARSSIEGLAADLRCIGERCERRSTRRALHMCAQHMALFASQIDVELELLQEEMKAIGK